MNLFKKGFIVATVEFLCNFLHRHELFVYCIVVNNDYCNCSAY